MHFCTAYVALAGDPEQIAHRGLFDPVSWPEIEVIRQMHGDDAVSAIRPFVKVDQSVQAERERLIGIYGGPIVEQCYPGRNPRMEMDAPDVELPKSVSWRNPITREYVMPDVPDPPAPASVPEKAKPGARKEAVI